MMKTRSSRRSSSSSSSCVLDCVCFIFTLIALSCCSATATVSFSPDSSSSSGGGDGGGPPTLLGSCVPTGDQSMAAAAISTVCLSKIKIQTSVERGLRPSGPSSSSSSSAAMMAIIRLTYTLVLGDGDDGPGGEGEPCPAISALAFDLPSSALIANVTYGACLERLHHHGHGHDYDHDHHHQQGSIMMMMMRALSGGHHLKMFTEEEEEEEPFGKKKTKTKHPFVLKVVRGGRHDASSSSSSSCARARDLSFSVTAADRQQAHEVVVVRKGLLLLLLGHRDAAVCDILSLQGLRIKERQLEPSPPPPPQQQPRDADPRERLSAGDTEFLRDSPYVPSPSREKSDNASAEVGGGIERGGKAPDTTNVSAPSGSVGSGGSGGGNNMLTGIASLKDRWTDLLGGALCGCLMLLVALGSALSCSRVFCSRGRGFCGGSRRSRVVLYEEQDGAGVAACHDESKRRTFAYSYTPLPFNNDDEEDVERTPPAEPPSPPWKRAKTASEEDFLTVLPRPHRSHLCLDHHEASREQRTSLNSA